MPANARRTVRLLPLALLAAGCSRHPPDRVWAEDAWMRLAAAPGRPSAAYVTLHGADRPNRLLAVDTPAAGSTELHEMLSRTGPDDGPPVMTMDRVDAIDVPARGEVDLAPGGYHVMLFGVSPTVKPGDRVPLVLKLARGAPVTIEAKAIAAGDPAPY